MLFFFFVLGKRITSRKKKTHKKLKKQQQFQPRVRASRPPRAMARRGGRDRRRRRPGSRRLRARSVIINQGRAPASRGGGGERCELVRAALRREAGREAPGGAVCVLHRDDGEEKGREKRGRERVETVFPFFFFVVVFLTKSLSLSKKKTTTGRLLRGPRRGLRGPPLRGREGTLRPVAAQRGARHGRRHYWGSCDAAQPLPALCLGPRKASEFLSFFSPEGQ